MRKHGGGGGGAGRWKEQAARGGGGRGRERGGTRCGGRESAWMKGGAMKDGSPLGKSCPHCPHAVPKFTLPTLSPAGCPRRFRASSCAKQPWQAERYLPRCHGFIKRLCLCGNCHPDGEREKKKTTLLQLGLARGSDKAVSTALCGAWEQDGGGRGGGAAGRGLQQGFCSGMRHREGAASLCVPVTEGQGHPVRKRRIRAPAG